MATAAADAGRSVVLGPGDRVTSSQLIEVETCRAVDLERLIGNPDDTQTAAKRKELADCSPGSTWWTACRHALVVAVVRVSRKLPVVFGEVASVNTPPGREETAQSEAGSVKDQCREQARHAPIAGMGCRTRRRVPRAGSESPPSGVGFHSEKRAGVRDPEFRKLPAAIQEEIAGTNYTTLRRIYDEVTAEDIREAWAEAHQVAK